MLPYLIAGAIGFGIGKLFENGGETFMAGGRITTNEDVLNSFLTSTKEVKVNNLSTHFNEYENLLLLRNYGTIIAGRYVNTAEKDYRYGTLNFCYVTKTKYSQTTTKILNKLKALATKMGYTITDACTFDDGGETFMAGGKITTNEDVLNSFLTSSKEVKANNLSTHFNKYDDFLLLRNYYTLIATRKGNDVKITNVKHSKTTSAITNRLKALAEEMGYNVSYVSKFENGGEMFMAGGMTNEDIIFKYPKDSNGRIMSWISVGTGNMEIASKTGTVGQVRDGHQLIVLKSETPNKVDYHILVDYLPEENKINMVRGKFNSEPSPKYQSYINDLFRMLKISQKTRDYQDEDIANQVYVKRYLMNNFGNPPKGCQIKATELGVEIHFDSTNKMSSDWAMKIGDKYGYPNGNFEMRYSSGNVPITYVDTSKIAKNTSKSEKGYFNFGETFMAGGNTSSIIEEGDSVIMYFNQDTELEIFDSEDFELEEPNIDIFKKGIEFEVDIFGVDDIKYDVQFGDGSVAFIRKDNVTIVSVNGDEYAGGGGVEYRIGGEVDKELTIEQTRKIAQETANILGTEFSVTKNSVDVASFDLDLNGEEFEGGSYLIMKNGDVLNVALPNNPVYYNYKERSKNPKMIRTIFEEEYFEDFDNGGEAGMIYLISDNATPKREINISENDILRESKKYFGWRNVSVKRIKSLGSTDYDKFIEFLYKKGYGKDEYAGGGLVVKNDSDLQEVAKYMTNAVKKHRWDLKDLIHYFEQENNFDYKKRVKIWEEMNGYEMPKTYNNIYEMLKRISEANGSKFADGGQAVGGVAKKRRRSASAQYGRSNTAVDKTRVAKPVGYRFTNAKASELRKDPYAKPTEAQIKKYLGKGIYKENRKRHSDKDRNAKL